MSTIYHHDIIIIGAGAAGLMCALTAGYRGKNVLLLDKAKQLGKKILISGGGRCNFTNTNLSPTSFLSNNPHFCKSALAGFNQWHFIEMLDRHGIEYHERELGQLFCNDSAKDIVNMLKTECDWAGVNIKLQTEINNISLIKATDNLNHLNQYCIETNQGRFIANKLVIATGGLSMPKLGATAFGYNIAKQFGLNVLPTSAGLVPFTWQNNDKEKYEILSGIALPVVVTSQSGQSFKEAMLFTHRGLSGPAILQISSYWHSGEEITINLLPEMNFLLWLSKMMQQSPKLSFKNALSRLLPKRLVERLIELNTLPNINVNQITKNQANTIASYLHSWRIYPNGTEGYRTAEVTLGGVDTNDLSSKTMESTKQQGLYFIGEVVDVTGWLGGFNFSWCWASGYAAGKAV